MLKIIKSDKYPILISKSITWQLIVNPAGGNWAVKKQLDAITSALRQAGFSFESAFSEYGGHATLLTKEAIKNGMRHIIALGGDGTANEVANGILSQKEVPTDAITFALLPVGTGNDWARTWRIPRDLTSWISMLAAGRTTHQDAGLVAYFENEKPVQRYFINVAGLSYDAFVVRYAEQKKHLMGNRFFYLWMILTCLFKFRLPKGRLEFDGKQVSDFFYTINVGICKYSGGGMQIVPQAIPDDGLLALTYALKVSKIGVILNTWRFYNGSIGAHSKIFTLQTNQVKISPDPGETILLEVDGEFLGAAPASFSILKKALKIVVP